MLTAQDTEQVNLRKELSLVPVPVPRTYHPRGGISQVGHVLGKWDKDKLHIYLIVWTSRQCLPLQGRFFLPVFFQL